MFGFLNIGPMELGLIMVVMLIVFGPGKLPEVAQSIGKAMREFRKASSNVQRVWDEVLQEEPPKAEKKAASTSTNKHEEKHEDRPEQPEEQDVEEGEDEGDTTETTVEESAEVEVAEDQVPGDEESAEVEVEEDQAVADEEPDIVEEQEPDQQA